MSFNWDDFLSLAQKLFEERDQNHPDEAIMRTVTSRAYYAAYHSALNNARETLNYSFYHTGNAHDALIAHYKNQKDLQLKIIGADLERIRDNRNQADYAEKIKDMAPVSLADRTTKTASKIIGAIRNIKNA